MADLTYIDTLGRRLAALLRTVTVKITPRNPRRAPLRKATLQVKRLRKMVARTGRGVGGVNLSRELLFLANGLKGLRSAQASGEVSIKEANQTLKTFRKTLRTILKALTAAYNREIEALAKTQTSTESKPLEDYNPSIPSDKKFDEYRRSLEENQQRLAQRQIEMQQRLAEDSKPIDYSNTQGARKEARLNEALDSLSELTRVYDREYIPTIPRKLDPDAYAIIKLPMVVYTEKQTPISPVRLRRAKIKTHELYPGYIFERQTVMVVPKNVPTAVQESYVREYARKKGYSFIEPLKGTDAPVITTPYAPKFAFYWLMKHADYTLLDVKITAAHLAFSQKPETLIHTDLSKLSRDLMLGRLSSRYDPDNYDSRLFVLDPDSKHSFRITRLPVLIEPELTRPVHWSSDLSFPVTKVSERQFILENQFMLVVRREHYTSAIVHSEWFQNKVAQFLATKHRKKMPMVNPLDGMAIVTDVNPSCAYIWLMPEREFNLLNRPRFIRFGFPFSGGMFSTGNAVMDSRRKRFSRHLNKLEKRLRKDKPLLFQVVTTFTQHVRDLDIELDVLEQTMDRIVRSIKREEIRLANLPLDKPDRILQFVPLEQLRNQLIKLGGIPEREEEVEETDPKTGKTTLVKKKIPAVPGKIDKLRDLRRAYHTIAHGYEKELNAHRDAMKDALLKTLRA